MNVTVLVVPYLTCREALRDLFVPEVQAVFTIELPPLRERGGGLPDLAAHFLARFSEQLKVDKHILIDTALKALGEHYWPGNVREKVLRRGPRRSSLAPTTSCRRRR